MKLILTVEIPPDIADRNGITLQDLNEAGTEIQADAERQAPKGCITTVVVEDKTSDTLQIAIREATQALAYYASCWDNDAWSLAGPAAAKSALVKLLPFVKKP